MSYTPDVEKIGDNTFHIFYKGRIMLAVTHDGKTILYPTTTPTAKTEPLFVGKSLGSIIHYLLTGARV
jgi:hypothetical protein